MRLVPILQELPKAIGIDHTRIQNRVIDIAARELATILRVAPTGRLDLKNNGTVGVGEPFLYSLAVCADCFIAFRAGRPYIDLPGTFTLIPQIDSPIQPSR